MSSALKLIKTIITTNDNVVDIKPSTIPTAIDAPKPIAIIEFFDRKNYF